ncbi:MFS general substrate transporter [Sistotremastrum suecicum HHB10207 ss-3]|uniref:MFS general substrate transporter n=1 Tax=Sistotremastrum suecicum HHB10207 ss-3 TaxID=1314776 RepID=A0A166ASC1_9AGAM|nr:MFS general substrate transporter [Sistotremastrum suecicum HHB10207 ss-3]
MARKFSDYPLHSISSALSSKFGDSLDGPTHEAGDVVWDGSISPPPDGGSEAWLVVAGVTALNMASGGFIVSWGIFQTFYENHVLSSHSTSDIAWIGSIQYALGSLPCLLTGRLFDLGYSRLLIYIGSFMLVTSTFMTAISNTYSAFLFYQGVVFGLAASITYAPTLGVIPQWFKEKQALAYAITSMGNPLGGILYSVMFAKMQPHLGFRGTMIVFSAVSLVLCLFAVATLKDRRSQSQIMTKVPKMFDLQGAMSSPAFWAYVAAIFTAYLGLLTPLTYITDQANSVGFPTSLGPYLVATVNTATIAGRLFCGALAVEFGPLNLMIISTGCCMFFTYIWTFVPSIAGYAAVACLYGASMGGFFSLYCVPVAQMVPVDDVGRTIGLLLTLLSIAEMVGPPISGAIADHFSFHAAGLYAGTSIAVAVFILAWSKFLQMGNVTRSKI